MLGRSIDKRVITPTLLENIDPSILKSAFGQGGQIVGFLELEKVLRQMIDKEIYL